MSWSLSLKSEQTLGQHYATNQLLFYGIILSLCKIKLNVVQLIEEFNETIILSARVGYEVIIANSALHSHSPPIQYGFNE